MVLKLSMNSYPGEHDSPRFQQTDFLGAVFCLITKLVALFFRFQFQLVS